MFRNKLFFLVLAIFSIVSTNAYAQNQKVKVAITGPSSMQPGSTISYTVSVTNVTNTTVTGVWIYHHFKNAAGFLDFLPAQSTPGCVYDTWSVVCPSAKNTVLGPNETKQYIVAYKVPDSVPCDTSVVAVADVRANNTDPHWSTLAIKASCPVTPAVLPTLDCVYNLGGGNYRAYFGYQNTGSQAVTIAAGTNTGYEYNYFNPGSANRGQPTIFNPGTKSAVFTVDFNGDPLTWVIRPRFGPSNSISASKNSKACFPIKPIAECRNLKPNNQYLTNFGYQNDNPFPVTLNQQLNKFSPAPEDRGQPMTFQPGRVAKAISILAPSGLTWTIGSLTAVSNNALPQCVNDLGPVCKIVASSNNNCGGASTTIALDGSQSSDPEGLALGYKWTTNCAGAVITNANTSKPTLTVNTGGKAVTCNISLAVNDSINSSVVCNTNISVNSCNFDCAGKLNGTATVDRCGVCEGNGQSCLECADIDTIDTKFALDIGAASQKQLIKKIVSRLKIASNNNPKYQPLIKSSLKEAEALYLQSWAVAWTSFPTVITNCSNTQFCQKTDYTVALDSYASSNDSLRAVALKLLRQISALRGSGDTREKANDKKQTQKVNALHDNNAAVLSTVPKFSSQCN